MQKNRLLVVALLVLLGCAITMASLWQQQEIRNDEVIFVNEDNDDFSPGPAVGSHFPGLRALHGTTPVSLLQSFAGSRGTLLVIVRALQQSPQCRAQLLQLERYKTAFDAIGVSLVILSPDTPATLQTFAQENAISLPLLSDIHSLSVTTLGVIDKENSWSAQETGPYPGILILDEKNRVAGKLFLRRADQRIESAALLAHVDAVLP